MPSVSCRYALISDIHANLEEPLTQYRQHFESVAFNKADEQWRCKAEIVGDNR